MEFLSAYLSIGLVILILMVLLWLASLRLKNSSIVDIFWGAGFVISAWAAFALTPVGAAGPLEKYARSGKATRMGGTPSP